MWTASRLAQRLRICTKHSLRLARQISTRPPLKLEERTSVVDPLTQINNVLSLDYGSEMATHKFDKILKDASESDEASRSTDALYWTMIGQYYKGLGTEIKDVEKKAEKLFNELCEQNSDEFDPVQYLLHRSEIGMKRRKKIKEDLICSALNFYLYQRFSFKEAYLFFCQQIQLYRTPIGLHSLLEYALRSYADDTAHINPSPTLPGDEFVAKSTQKILRDRINELQEKCRIHLPTGEFIAHLVVSMLVTGHVEDAKAFSRLFLIDGALYISSLRKLAEEDDISSIECFAEILESVYYPEQKAEMKKKKGDSKKPKKVEEKDPTQCKFNFLHRVWRPFKIKTFAQLKQPAQAHKLDASSMKKLLNSFVTIWLQKANELDDLESLDKFCAFVQRNEVQLGKRNSWICKKAYERNQQTCPLPLDDLDVALKI